MQQQMQVQIPAGMAAGSQFQVQAPDGQMLTVQVPPGGVPGATLMIPYTPIAQATVVTTVTTVAQRKSISNSTGPHLANVI